MSNTDEGVGPVGVSVNPAGANLPDVTLVVNPGNVVSPSGSNRIFTEGEEITVDGPTAIHLQSSGIASVKQ